MIKGNCNVVKEIIYPEGAESDIRSVVVGDNTLSVLEIWGAEYQEQDALLIKPENEQLLRAVCDRERVSMAVIGSISGSGKITLVDSKAIAEAAANRLPAPNPAVDLDLEKVLGDMPRKRFEFTRQQPLCEPLELAAGVTVMDALRRVLHLPSVSSKRFLTTKVDRCVTGLVAQQQTVGPLQLSLSDVAVIAQSYTGLTGGACAIGEQPVKGLLNPKAMARLAVGEALTNLVWAKVSALEDVKASGNWMYAAKLGGEGACMYDAAVALRDAMIDLKIAIDGGKDSLSMAAQAGGELVKAPGDLVISVYAPCPDITKTVTPDLKLGDKGAILFIDLAKGKRRLGGSALAQVFDQISDDCPDLEDVGKAFSAVQCLLDKKLISAGHDISDGGIVVALLEMAFSGSCGLKVSLEASEKVQLKGRPLFEVLFAEELGLLLEVDQHKQEEVIAELAAAGVSCAVIGHVTASRVIDISVSGHECIRASMPELRDVWEETSFMLERLQRLDSCVEAEQLGMKGREVPSWKLSFMPTKTSDKFLSCTLKPKVAIIREEGSNGDREMSGVVHAAGFEPWDISMSDLLSNIVNLQDFRGVVFVGGFSYADVLDSGKGWAATIRFNESLLHQFQEFYKCSDTFSLGVCNGWVPGNVGSELEV
ncbi:hypothetical protein GOP47_0024963 [Adiantum capillus-veneris]|uniref:phosphoribosylformylglycinamidine synthase n=1 Tax=Adiantum capillus-veneris TaxID=13818 RepID=A0A9D4U3Y3_ADICA|nr:hypothetical protein GOP47_0024963 [Adiantum capillus-veneris]